MWETEELWDWRRRIADLYHDIRHAADARAAWEQWRDTRAEMFRTHPQSPIEPEDRPSYRGPATYPYDPGLRFDVRLLGVDAEQLTFPTGSDGDTVMRPFARTDGLQPRLGGELTLYWVEGYGGGVFLPFADATNGRETFGGGRYVLDTIKGADFGHTRPGGTLVLDFNFAYAPSCSYSDRYVCPLAPAGNRLPGAVPAGERLIS